jgi:hypothetical protein
MQAKPVEIVDAAYKTKEFVTHLHRRKVEYQETAHFHTAGTNPEHQIEHYGKLYYQCPQPLVSQGKGGNTPTPFFDNTLAPFVCLNVVVKQQGAYVRCARFLGIFRQIVDSFGVIRLS